MLRRITLTAGLTLAFLLQGVHPAGAVTLVTPDGHTAQPYQGWADASRVPTPPITVTLTLTACPGSQAPACALVDGAAIWLLPEAFGTKRRYALLHELGHEFDYHVMTPAARAGFEKITGDGRPWRSPPNSPHERFAEAYMACAMFAPIASTMDGHVKGTGGYDYQPTLAQHRRVCALIRRVGRRAGL